LLDVYIFRKDKIKAVSLLVSSGDAVAETAIAKTTGTGNN
jgi:hypothetical protein